LDPSKEREETTQNDRRGIDLSAAWATHATYLTSYRPAAATSLAEHLFATAAANQR
jgi:hypothetical protein